MKFNIVKFKPKTTQIKGLECLNCGKPLDGDENFCSYCGQKNTIKKLNFGTFLNNMFNGFFSYDSRFWRTFIPILTKPGKVSKDYIAGKRARFVNPFQLYLNISIVFFLVLGISNRIDDKTILPDNLVTNLNQLDSLSNENSQQIDSIINETTKQVVFSTDKDSTNKKVIANLGDVFKITQKENNKEAKEYVYHKKTDSTGHIRFINKIQDFINFRENHPKFTSETALDSLGYKKNFWNKFHYEQVKNTYSNFEQIESDGGKSYIKKLTSAISISLFVFLPIFTLFLMLIYYRRKFTYMEHLVFVFNTQTVFFLLLTIFYLLDFIVDIENLAGIFTLLFLFYLYKAMRNFYEQSRVKTIVKYIILNSFYMFLGFIGILIVAAISFVFN